MCGRYTRKEELSRLADVLRILLPPDLKPRYNIAPGQMVPAVRNHAEGGREFVMLKWGLIPSWAKDPSIGYKMINARTETVAEKPSFRKSFKHQRCLILADGFYEWKREGKAKQPYYIHFKDSRPCAFAGLWERWEDKQKADTVIESCTIITCGANQVMEPIHHRMPVILEEKDYDVWLDPLNKGTEVLTKLLQPYQPDDLEAYPVSTIVNNPRNNSVACVKPL